MRSYNNPRGSVQLSKALLASGGIAESGHPLFSDLEVGQQGNAAVASLFLDLSDFTGRSFWDDPRDVARLADAVLSGFTGIVHALGGHVLGLRGDGLFAGFGPTNEPGSAVAVAGLAAAGSLHAVNEVLNPMLEAEGIKRVQARAGADYGELTFTRTGTRASSEVNVVGFSANFAAKNEKRANAWEVVVGQGFVDQMGDQTLVTRHEKSPKPFTRDGETRYYHFYDYSWRRVLNELDGVVSDLAGRPLEVTEY